MNYIMLTLGSLIGFAGVHQAHNGLGKFWFALRNPERKEWLLVAQTALLIGLVRIVTAGVVLVNFPGYGATSEVVVPLVAIACALDCYKIGGLRRLAKERLDVTS